MRESYVRARREGEKAVHRAAAEGRWPYLQSLEHILPEYTTLPKISVGVMDIPLDRIAGTVTEGRENAFAWNFMPLLKPLALISYCILNSSMSNTLVLDPFLGSGTTMMACQQLDRSCFGLELDPKYCDVIINRYIELVGSTDGITVERNGTVLTYEQAKSLVESTEEADG